MEIYILQNRLKLIIKYIKFTIGNEKKVLKIVHNNIYIELTGGIHRG